jgi:ABC-2 type transport system ATP-binding protein
LISCRNLGMRFGDFTAVDGVTFDIPAGGVCALLGPNGAGKSTIMKMLTGVLAPTLGEASVGGHDVRRDSLAVRRIAGILPENLGLFDLLTVGEHLLLSGPIYGLSAAETRARAEQLLEALGLKDARDTFAAECSHGMRKKTALALALLHNPRVLFLDEPFEAIDPVTAHTIRDLLAAVARRGVTVFLTSHILSIVDRLAEWIIVLRNGRIVLQSAANELPRSLEEHYFEVAEPLKVADLTWLGSFPS